MDVDRLFVYGTLRRGSNNPFARLLSERAEFLSNGRVAGLLYDFGSYPGAVQGDHIIHGEVFHFADPQLLTMLDEYEGSEYSRAAASVQMDAGAILDCWIYWYVGAKTGRRINSGDWFKR